MERDWVTNPVMGGDLCVPMFTGQNRDVYCVGILIMNTKGTCNLLP